jgi:hypothetical protein
MHPRLTGARAGIFRRAIEVVEPHDTWRIRQEVQSLAKSSASDSEPPSAKVRLSEGVGDLLSKIGESGRQTANISSS